VSFNASGKKRLSFQKSKGGGGVKNTGETRLKLKHGAEGGHRLGESLRYLAGKGMLSRKPRRGAIESK